MAVKNELINIWSALGQTKGALDIATTVAYSKPRKTKNIIVAPSVQEKFG